MNVPHKPADDAIFRLWLKEIGAKKVLDFGCGTGLWRYMFKDYNYTGVDQNTDMIAGANERFPQEPNSFKKITWDNVEIPDSSFDVIFTSAVIQHNIHTHKEVMLNEFKRILKKDGYYMCTECTFKPDNYWHVFKGLNYNEDISDGYSFTVSGWTKFMKQNGFELIKFEEPDMYLWKKV